MLLHPSRKLPFLLGMLHGKKDLSYEKIQVPCGHVYWLPLGNKIVNIIPRGSKSLINGGEV